MVKPNPIRLFPYITKETIAPYLISFWDEKLKDRIYEIYDTEIHAQQRFFQLIQHGTLNVSIYQHIQGINYDEYPHLEDNFEDHIHE